MASFSIPSFPKFSFPRINSSASAEELAVLCNTVLDGISELVEGLDADVRKALVGGKHQARVWACFQVKKSYEVGRRSGICSYYEQLEEARLTAIESPLVQFMHRSVIDGLAVKAELGMPERARQELLNSLWAVRNLERDAEHAEQTVVRGARKGGPSAEQLRRRKERSERDREATAARKGQSPSAQPGTMGRQGAKRARAAAKR